MAASSPERVETLPARKVYPEGYRQRAVELYREHPSLSYVHDELCQLYQAAHPKDWESAQDEGKEWLGPHPATVWRWIMDADQAEDGAILAQARREKSHLLGEVFSTLAGEAAQKSRNARTSVDAKNFAVTAGIAAERYQDLVGGGLVSDPPRRQLRTRGRPDGGVKAGAE